MAERAPSPIRNALAAPRFRRLFIANTISRWGDTFNAVALVILVFRLTGSGIKVAGTVAFEIVPVILLGFVAGYVVDRFHRTQVMVAADLGRAAIAFGLAFAHGQLWFIYAAAFGFSSLTVFFNPAASSVIPALVEEDDVVGANSALWSAAVISQIVLAPLAGALVAFAGPGPAFAINGASFVMSAVLLTRLKIPRPAEVPRTSWHQVTEGLRVVRASRFLSVLTGVQAMAALSAGATSALLVVLAEDHLRVGPTHFGFLLAAIGIGAAAGPLLLQRLTREVRTPLFLFGPYLLRGTVDLGLAASSSFVFAVPLLGAYGIGTSTGMIAYNSALQRNVADSVRGRIFAFYDVVWQSSRLLSIGIGGFLADRLGITVVYALGGVLLLCAGALGMFGLSSRQLQSPIGPTKVDSSRMNS